MDILAWKKSELNVQKMLEYIRKIEFHTVSREILFLVYQGLIESHLRYGNLIWGHLPEKNSAHCRRYKTTRQGILPY